MPTDQPTVDLSHWDSPQVILVCGELTIKAGYNNLTHWQKPKKVCPEAQERKKDKKWKDHAC